MSSDETSCDEMFEAVKAVDWGRLQAETILRLFQPICWYALDSEHGLWQEELGQLRKQVIDLAIEWIGQEKINAAHVLFGMAAQRVWHERIAVVALHKVAVKYQKIERPQEFCCFLAAIGGQARMSLFLEQTQQTLREVTQDFLLEAELTKEGMQAVVLFVGGEPGLAMLSCLAGTMSVDDMNELWQVMCCFEMQAPLAADSYDQAQQTVDMLNKFYKVESFFENPWG